MKANTFKIAFSTNFRYNPDYFLFIYTANNCSSPLYLLNFCFFFFNLIFITKWRLVEAIIFILQIFSLQAKLQSGIEKNIGKHVTEKRKKKKDNSECLKLIKGNVADCIRSSVIQFTTIAYGTRVFSFTSKRLTKKKKQKFLSLQPPKNNIFHLLRAKEIEWTHIA